MLAIIPDDAFSFKPIYHALVVALLLFQEGRVTRALVRLDDIDIPADCRELFVVVDRLRFRMRQSLLRDEKHP